MKVLHSYKACADCVGYIEFGLSGMNEVYSEIEKFEIARAIIRESLEHNCSFHVTMKPLGFSWDCCELCDRRLAGDRFEVEALIPSVFKGVK